MSATYLLLVPAALLVIIAAAATGLAIHREYLLSALESYRRFHPIAGLSMAGWVSLVCCWCASALATALGSVVPLAVFVAWTAASAVPVIVGHVTSALETRRRATARVARAFGLGALLAVGSLVAYSVLEAIRLTPAPVSVLIAGASWAAAALLAQLTIAVSVRRLSKTALRVGRPL